MKKTYFTLDDDFEEIIKRTLNNKKIININPISTGWTNIVFEVNTDDGNFFFRFPRRDFWIKTIIKDAKFTQFIHNKTDFNTVKLNLFYDKERPYTVHEKIEGVTLAEKMESLKPEEIKTVAQEISKFMYQLHNIKINIKDEWPNLNDFLDELINTFLSDKDKVFWNYNNFIDKNQVCLVHGDLNSSNIILDENNHISAIIDFGFAGFGDKYSDIARIIGRCPENYKNEIVKDYELLSSNKLDENVLESKIDTWQNIDNGYINYMKGIGEK